MAERTMNFSPGGLVAAALRTITAPKEEAEVVIAERLPQGVLWIMMTVVVAVSVVLGQGSLLLVWADGGMLTNPYLANPLLMFGVQMAILVIMVFATYHIGHWMGGMGGFGPTVAIVTWLQFVLVCLQVVQTAALFLLPPVADLLGIAGLILFLWLFTNFVAVLHGFASLGLVFVMILMSAFGVTFIISLILTMIGVTAPGDMNV